MNRRRFLQGSVALPLLAAARPVAEVTASGTPTAVASMAAASTAPGQAARPAGAQGAGRGRRVIVLGAGLAGLSAARELVKAGWDPIVLEARMRPGGRVHTLREPFSDGLYAEAGAARIQDAHALTLQYVKDFNLTLDPFWPSAGQVVTRVADTRVVHPRQPLVDLKKIPLPFSDEERQQGLGASFVKYLFGHIPTLGDTSADDWISRDPARLARFERTISDFCRAQGASPALVRMVALGHDLGPMSTLQLLRDAALGATTKNWWKIRGGNDQLPRALAASLADRIQYGAAVTRITQDDAGVRVHYSRVGLQGAPETGGPLSIAGEFIVCTIPPPVLRRIDITPPISSLKRAAIDEVELMPIARVYLQARRRFWIERGDCGWANTDDPMDVWDYSRDQPGPRGLLGAYTSGRMARQITALDPAARGPFLLELMERVHPGMREHFEGAASYSWVSDQWALGAAAEFKPGQLTTYYDALRAPEGRIHFAGEHTSPWTGWMNGAFDSGHRAAAEITRRAAR